jgi:hypothetical protein
MDKHELLTGLILDGYVPPISDPDRGPFATQDLPPSLAPYIKTQQPVTFPMWLDNTAREALSLCKRKGYYTHWRNIIPTHMSEHLVFGSAYAKGLEVARKGFYGQGLDADEAILDGLIAAWKDWGHYIPPEKSIKTLENLERSYLTYFQRFPMATDYIRPYMDSGEPAVEFTFAIPIPDVVHPETGDPILYVGRFDMLAEFRTGVWVMDDKTASQLGARWRDQWDMSPQMTGYCWACREYNFNVSGALIRGNSPQTEVKIEEAVTYRKDWQINEWLELLVADVKASITCWEQSHWPKVYNAACNLYSGCPYRALCTSRNPEDIIPVNYRHRVWDPLAEQE